MQRNMDANASNLKFQLMMLQEIVSGFQREELSHRDTALVKRMKALTDVELEWFEKKRENKELELKKRELAVKLVAAQERITSLSNFTESKSIARIEKELTTLKNHNEDRWNQAERLQQNRFSMVEELVYQRWLNACLRFEILNNGRNPSKWELISKNTNKKPHEKSKQLLSDDSSSSNNSSTDSDTNDSTTTATTGSSSSSQRRSIRRRISFTDSATTVISTFRELPGSAKIFSHTVSSSGAELAREEVQEISLPEASVVKTVNEQQPLRKREDEKEQSSGIPNKLVTENKVDDDVQIIVVLFIFGFIVVACLLLLAAGVH